MKNQKIKAILSAFFCICFISSSFAIYEPNQIDPKDDANKATYAYALESAITSRIEQTPVDRFGAPMIMLSNLTDETLMLEYDHQHAYCAFPPPKKIEPKSAAVTAINFSSLFCIPDSFDYVTYYKVGNDGAKLAIHIRNLRDRKVTAPDGNTAIDRLCTMLNMMSTITSLIPLVGTYMSAALSALSILIPLHPPVQPPDPNDLTFKLNAYIYPQSGQYGGAPMCLYMLDKKGKPSYDSFYFMVDSALNEPGSKYIVQCSCIRSYETKPQGGFTQPFYSIKLFYKTPFLEALNKTYAKDIRDNGLDNKDEKLKKLVDLYLDSDFNDLVEKGEKAGGANNQFVAEVLYNEPLAKL